MAYCDQDDIEARISQSVLIQLTDDEKSATSSTTLDAAIVLNSAITARITAAITDADALIDSYLRKQVAVPLATTPNQINRISVDLAIWFLHKRRRSEMGMPDDVKEDYRDAVAYLLNVNKGIVDLGVEPEPAASAVVVADADGEDRLFTETTLEDF